MSRRTSDEVIDAAVQLGQRVGIDALDARDRWIYLIAEAEVLCDKDGIDTFIHAYGAVGLAEIAEAYSRIGAGSLVDSLRAVIDALPNPSEAALGRVNELVSNREGYDYDAIRVEVTNELVRTGGRQLAMVGLTLLVLRCRDLEQSREGDRQPPPDNGLKLTQDLASLD